MINLKCESGIEQACDKLQRGILLVNERKTPPAKKSCRAQDAPAKAKKRLVDLHRWMRKC